MRILRFIDGNELLIALAILVGIVILIWSWNTLLGELLRFLLLACGIGLGIGLLLGFDNDEQEAGVQKVDTSPLTDALQSLGMTRDEIDRVLPDINFGEPIEDQISAALRSHQRHLLGGQGLE